MSFTLLADIGGTNTRFVLAKEGHGILPGSYEAFSNSSANSPESLIRRYFQNQGIASCKQVVLALAAPTYGEEIVLTNHDWCFTIKSISAVSGAQDVHFINDLEALGYGLSALKPEQVQHLAGPSISGANGPRVVIGVGTGFNAAVVTQAANGDHYVKAMEVGHMTLTVETQAEFDLWQYLAQDRERASIERALSGLGIEQIYQWHCQNNSYKPSHINARGISSAALNKSDPMAEKAMQICANIYARTVGDLALAFLPKGGIFLSGSVTRAMAPWLQGSDFFDGFLAKGRQRDLMRQFPIYLLQDDQAALLGCEIAASYSRKSQKNKGVSPVSKR